MDAKTEQRLMAIAEAMHGELCGCDDKTCELTTEIYDWLYNGDDPRGYTLEMVPDFIKEWNEYAGEA